MIFAWSSLKYLLLDIFFELNEQYNIIFQFQFDIPNDKIF